MTDDRPSDSVPLREYGARRDRHRLESARLDVLDARIAYGRLGVFVAAVVMAFRVVRGDAAAWWLILPIAGFVALVVLHERTLRKRTRARRAADLYEHGLDRLNDRWAGRGPTGDAFVPADHPYARDLDIVGPKSLFQLMATARTGPGRETLAWWLISSESIANARERSTAVEELSPCLDLREDVALLGDAVENEVAPDSLRRWGSGPPTLSPTLRAIAIGLTAATLIAAVLWAVKISTAIPFLVSVMLVMLFWTIAGRRVQAVIAAADEPARELRVLAAVLDRIERESFASPLLCRMQTELEETGEPPIVAVARLARLIDLIDSSRNQLFGPVAFVTLWHVHLAYRVEAWRARYGAALDGWLTRAGELDALLAISGFAYEHPDYVAPEFDEGTGRVHARALGHPLLPRGECVKNDVMLGGEGHSDLIVVSGSNMSGKSTLLRTIGINVVLAFLGAPVCADALTTGAVAIGASIRTTDSLLDGRSRFYAEIVRLKTLVDLAQGKTVTAVNGPRLLFLIDEILAGTNSHDRRRGADALLADLVERGAVGLATTHDLALTEIAERMPRARNAHFSDRFVDGRLEFDYRLREGVVQTSNALELMRSVGLRV